MAGDDVMQGEGFEVISQREAEVLKAGDGRLDHPLAKASEWVAGARAAIAKTMLSGMEATRCAFNPRTGEFVESDIPDHMVRIRSAEITAKLTRDITSDTNILHDNRKQIIQVSDESAKSIAQIARELAQSRTKAFDSGMNQADKADETPLQQ